MTDSAQHSEPQHAPDDVVRTWEEVAPGARLPLLVVEPLLEFMDSHGLGAGDELSVESVGEGHSNVTYLLRRGSTAELILRRPPRPPLPPSAHNVGREAQLLGALSGTAARVPGVLAACSDETIIGAPFYIMERIAGDVITQVVPQELDTTPQRARIADELIDALVEVHAVDWQQIGLEGFGKPTGYLERQLRRFMGLWEINRTRELGAVERVGTWLADNLPASPAATIVHGDYRLGNVMFAPGAPARLTAIFDWEMATIGDPLADLGYMCALWIQGNDPSRGMFELTGVTRAEGFPTREQLIASYEQRSGRSMSEIRWYTTLALWKSVVFMEGNYKRAISGSTDDPFLKSFGDGVLDLAARAEEVAHGDSD
ncbi:MAG: phosphotransferase family protein [Solirubrobacteraceae bacterium]